MSMCPRCQRDPCVSAACTAEVEAMRRRLDDLDRRMAAATTMSPLIPDPEALSSRCPQCGGEGDILAGGLDEATRTYRVTFDCDQGHTWQTMVPAREL